MSYSLKMLNQANNKNLRRAIKLSMLAIPFGGLMISLWFLIANLQPIEPAYMAFAVLILLGICLVLVLELSGKPVLDTLQTYTYKLIKLKYFFITALVGISLIGLLARLFFYFRFSYAPISDPMTFFKSAQDIAADKGQLGNTYVAFQPYLAGYNTILGQAMKLISDPWLATILINTFFDVLSALLIYLLVKKMSSPNSPLTVLAFGVWLLNPLNIIFSVLSLPIILVNFFIILSVLLSFLLLQQLTELKVKHSLLLSLILGAALGFGNWFRPIFSVVIIALVITCAYIFTTTRASKKFIRLVAANVALSTVVCIAIQAMSVVFVSHQTGLHAAKNPSGWSMFVGSTIETSGEWRPFHNNEMSSICERSLARQDFNTCHTELRNAAIEHYKDYGLARTTGLFIKKLYHQAGQQNYFYNAEQSLAGFSNSKTATFINTYMIVYMTTAFILSARFLYMMTKHAASNNKVPPMLVFAALLLIGWFLLFMIAESAPRYSTILYPLFILFSVLALGNTHKIRYNADSH